MRFKDEEFGKLKEMLVPYKCALMNMKTRLDILLEDFNKLQSHNPIEHVKERMKSPESMAEKLNRLGHEITAENARQHLRDIAGLRCICSFTKDIPFVTDVLKRQPDIIVAQEKDYITHPKPSGYRSYHLILEIPVHLSQKTALMPVEVQLRTQAMDFWAALEHKVRYKYIDGVMPAHLAHDLLDCAEKIAELDGRMALVQDLVDIAYTHTVR